MIYKTLVYPIVHTQSRDMEPSSARDLNPATQWIMYKLDNHRSYISKSFRPCVVHDVYKQNLIARQACTL